MNGKITLKEWQEKLDNLNKWREGQRGPDGKNKVINDVCNAVKGYVHYNPGVIFSLAKKKGKVLDVGCGDHAQWKSVMKDCEYTGIDPVCEDKEKNILKMMGEEIAGKLLINSFDHVICFSTLQHCYNPDNFLEGIRYVLRQEGYLYMTVVLFGKGGLYTYEFTEADIYDLMERHNFKIDFDFCFNGVMYLMAKQK
jgi:2-polyprenyl-3-methyl-5-hydroxy-6-metoxy-1,4-benzoquinol methylase